MEHLNSTVMISVDAKCKVSVREADFIIAAVCKGKVLIVGKCEKFKVGDYGFSKVSVIQDGILVHSTLEEDHRKDGQDTKCNKDTVGKMYSGKVFYSIKDKATQGSSAIRMVTERRMRIKDFLRTKRYFTLSIFV